MSLAEQIAALPPLERAHALAGMDDDASDRLMHDWDFWARPEQFEPTEEWWIVWAIITGRGFGKTRTGAEWVYKRVRRGARRIGLIGRTINAVREDMVNGEGGIMSCGHPDERPRYQPSLRLLIFPNGARAVTYTSEEPDQLRGPNLDTIWGDEFATWKFKPGADGLTAFDNAEFALRSLGSGLKPRMCLTSTPRPIAQVRDLVARVGEGPGSNVYLTRGSLYDNAANLAPSFIDRIIGKFAGTRMASQEIMGMVMEDVAGALWKSKRLDELRVTTPPALSRIVVGVDSTGNDGEGDECGIIVVGRSLDLIPTPLPSPDNPELIIIKNLHHIYVLDDLTIAGPPEEWSRIAVAAKYNYNAECIVVEKDYGGTMNRTVIKSIDPHVRVELSRAQGHGSKGERAKPVAQLADQGREHHVGTFPDLETQKTTWVPGETKDSPDRIDALVHAVRWLLPSLQQGPLEAFNPAGVSLPSILTR